MKDITRRESLSILVGLASNPVGFLKELGSLLHAETDQEVGLRFPLVSRPDYRTELDDDLAEKARKLAEYVITKPDHPGVRTYGPLSLDSEDTQAIGVSMIVGDTRYTISVYNRNPDARFHSPDVLSIRTRPSNDIRFWGSFDHTHMQDQGLDGRCDIGGIPARESPTGEGLHFQQGTENGLFLSMQLENGPIFQELYLTTLDTLLAFYEAQ